jgi:nitroimidazol reductase NimA-like FMN-containing flavoprotein (pyridoxamine 5'-phosphate oxidase superfamily)
MNEAIEMSDDERDEVLGRATPMRFASYGEGSGMPHVVPVWHAYIDGTLYFDSDEASVKVRNVRETGVGAGVVDGGETYADLHGVLVQGEARVIEDEDEREKVLLHNVDKWFDGEVPEFVRARNESVDRVSVALELDHVTTWDFGKVFG